MMSALGHERTLQRRSTMSAWCHKRAFVSQAGGIRRISRRTTCRSVSSAAAAFKSQPSASRNVAATTTMLATAADADFENLLAVASTMFSGIAGSTRIVFERGASLFALQELRRELSLMCRSYLLASRRARQGD